MLKICLNFVYFVANCRHMGFISVSFDQLPVFNTIFIHFLYSHYLFSDIWDVLPDKDFQILFYDTPES